MIHAITAMLAFDKAKKREAILRLCPNCRAEQNAAIEKINEPVSCKKCGAEISPKAIVRSAAGENKQTNE